VRQNSGRTWLARLLIAAVIAWNLQAAIALLTDPSGSAGAFELSGAAGEAAVRGVAVLFVMWNIPYLVACWQPQRQRASLWVALAMQAVGVVGESLILLSLPAGHEVLAGSLRHFIGFDAAGLVLLVISLLLTRVGRGIEKPAV
jgi:hypothetical protein